jgi:hypothetical protein
MRNHVEVVPRSVRRYSQRTARVVRSDRTRGAATPPPTPMGSAEGPVRLAYEVEEGRREWEGMATAPEAGAAKEEDDCVSPSPSPSPSPSSPPAAVSSLALVFS